MLKKLLIAVDRLPSPIRAYTQDCCISDVFLRLPFRIILRNQKCVAIISCLLSVRLSLLSEMRRINV